MLKALIVDDEQHCIDKLSKLLVNYSDILSIEGSYTEIQKAKEAIGIIEPDVVFLDVHLHEHTGFDLLKQLPKINFEVVFTTAYDTYAVEAFRFSALDYLLKPIDDIEFSETIQKIKEKVGQKETEKKLEVLFHNFEHKVTETKKMAIPTFKGLTFVKIDEIVRFQADGNYTHIFMVTNKKLTATRTLKHFEELLKSSRFFRVHKSHYINMNRIEKYIKGKAGHVLMTDGASIEIAGRRKEEFLKKLLV